MRLDFIAFKKWVASCFVFFICFVSIAQHPAFYRLGEEKLNGVDIYDLIQDNTGIYWIATDKGLMKFDGYTFKNIPSVGLLSNSLFEIKADYSNNIYCKNLSGQIFRIEEDTLKLFFSVPDSLRSFEMHYDFDNENALFVSTKFLLRKRKGERLEIVDYKNKGEAFYTEFVKLEDSSIVVYNSRFNEFLFYKNGAITTKEIFSKVLEGIYQQYYINDKLHYFEKGGGLMYKMKNDSLLLVEKSKVLEDEQLKRFYTDGKYFWMAIFSGGIKVYDENFNSEFGGEIILKNTIVSAFFKDKEGNLLLGTFGEGIVVIPNSKLINLTLTQPLERVTKITSDSKNNLFLGTQSGKIYRVDSGNKTSVIAESLEKNIELLEYFPMKNQLFYDARVPVMLNLTNGESVQKEFGSVKDVELINNGKYILGTNVGVFYFTEINEEFRGLRPFNLRTYCVNYNKTNELIYAGTSNGLLIGDEDEANFIDVKGKTVTCNDIKVFKGLTYIATQNIGLLVYENKIRINQWTEKEGLISNSINQIQIHNNQLYLATSKGLQIIDVEGKSKVIIGKSEGLGANNIVDFEISNNRLWLLHQKGVQFIALNNLPKFNFSPSVEISQLLVNDSIYSMANNQKLNYLDNRISFTVIASNLQYSSEILYKYRLEGIEDKWQTQSYFNNTISYKSLPAGNYTFNVKTVCRGLESDLKSYAFSISQPFWNTWWFYSLLVFFFIGTTILIFKIQAKRHRKKVQLKNELNASKLIAIQSQMNPHFIFNAINSIQDLILKGDIDNSYSYIIKFSNLVRKTLNFSDKEFIDIEEEIELLRVYLDLEKLRFDASFQFTIETENCADVLVPPMLVQPIVENAIKHGLLHKKGSKDLLVRFVKNEKLVCIVSDNGIGREKAREIKERQNKGHKSFSVSAIKNRFEIMRSQYEAEIGVEYTDLYENGEAEGTLVEINMPFKRKY